MFNETNDIMRVISREQCERRQIFSPSRASSREKRTKPILMGSRDGPKILKQHSTSQSMLRRSLTTGRNWSSSLPQWPEQNAWYWWEWNVGRQRDQNGLAKFRNGGEPAVPVNVIDTVKFLHFTERYYWVSFVSAVSIWLFVLATYNFHLSILEKFMDNYVTLLELALLDVE